MKMVKSLLLGTAAGLVAMSFANAATLPDKAKPVHFAQTSDYLILPTYLNTMKHLSAGAVSIGYAQDNYVAGAVDYGTPFDHLKAHAFGHQNTGLTALPLVATKTRINKVAGVVTLKSLLLGSTVGAPALDHSSG